MSTLVRDVCRLYPASFVGHETIETNPLPTGWRGHILAMLGDLVEVLGAKPRHRIVIISVLADGLLRVAHHLRPMTDEDSPMPGVVSTIIAAAERRCLQTCDVCADPGVLRVAVDGSRTVRCEIHGIKGSVVIAPEQVHPVRGLASSVSASAVPGTGSTTLWLCGVYDDTILDRTGTDEVPPGWRRLCSALLTDVVAMLPRHRQPGSGRFELHRMYADGEVLRWDVRFSPGTPDIVQRGIGIAMRRASEEAAWTCPRCGRREEGVLDGEQETCTCGTIRSSLSKRLLAPAVNLPRVPPGVFNKGSVVARSPRQTRIGTPAARDGFRIPIYRRADVAASMGLATDGQEGPDLVIHGEGGDTEQHARLQALLARGDDGRWRELAAPRADAIAAVAALAKVAPHLEPAIDHMVRHLRAAAAIGLPISLPPTLLLGPPGVGKTWLLSQVSQRLGLPQRLLPMNLTTTVDGISGAHPVWRNSGPGVVAKVLLAEDVANPVILVDEFDKARLHNGVDPYTAFYTLFERVGARAFVDEYFGMPFDASRILWIASANDLSPIPEPILNRLTIIDVPMPSPEHMAAVMDSVYAEANVALNGYFDKTIDAGLRRRLAGLPPRSIRVMIEDAMVRAAAVGRRQIQMSDLVERRTGERVEIGFVRGPAQHAGIR